MEHMLPAIEDISACPKFKIICSSISNGTSSNFSLYATPLKKDFKKAIGISLSCESINFIIRSGSLDTAKVNSDEYCSNVLSMNPPETSTHLLGFISSRGRIFLL
jgi:hypothetical protein